MNENSMLKPALIGGIALGIASALPVIGLFNCICCAWIIAGGVLAAHLYVKDSSVPVTLGRGVLLGLLTGFIGGIVYGLFSLPIQMAMTRGAGVMEQLKERMSQFPNMTPEMQTMLESFAEHSGIFYAFQLISMLGFCCLFGMAGGAIGVAIFEKRKPGSPAIDVTPRVPPYEPPSSVPPPPPPDAR